MEYGRRTDADRLATAGEDREAVLGEILARERERLRRMVDLRLLRMLAGQKLVDAQRAHLGAQKRDAGRNRSS